MMCKTSKRWRRKTTLASGEPWCSYAQSLGPSSSSPCPSISSTSAGLATTCCRTQTKMWWLWTMKTWQRRLLAPRSMWTLPSLSASSSCSTLTPLPIWSRTSTPRPPMALELLGSSDQSSISSMKMIYCCRKKRKRRKTRGGKKKSKPSQRSLQARMSPRGTSCNSRRSLRKQILSSMSKSKAVMSSSMRPKISQVLISRQGPDEEGLTRGSAT
mmetsp:Transcript_39209/g.37619  ORF Transcript_39209/g.37619 Transcript_39209/m.37619 type:complete len:214 (+) Transcript_39209:615-1256(+)